MILLFKSFLYIIGLPDDSSIRHSIFLMPRGFYLSHRLLPRYRFNIASEGIQSLIQIIFQWDIIFYNSSPLWARWRFGCHHGLLSSILFRNELLMASDAITIPRKVSRIALDSLVLRDNCIIWCLNSLFIYFHLQVFVDVLAAGVDGLNFGSGVLLMQDVLGLELLVSCGRVIDPLTFILEHRLILLYLGYLLVF